ncbi:hypothetical protein VEE30_15030 [Escherichia coli]|nr:hypothetical protein VEE30_15030 [Escherichia coli]
MPPSLRKAVAAAIGGGAIAIASVLITGPSGNDGLEGVSYIPYKDIVGVWTVCHGHISALVICIIVGLSWAVNHYRDNAITYKAQRDKNARELKLANAAITDMQMRQRDVAALDAKYTKELADAKAENDALRDDVAAGRRRLHIKAVCQSVREATTASGVDNAASPRLADTAERDYFTLRERLITMQKQLEGTQKYINEQCR